MFVLLFDIFSVKTFAILPKYLLNSSVISSVPVFVLLWVFIYLGMNFVWILKCLLIL